MDPIRNPYVPGAGVQPPELSGREAMLGDAQIMLARTRLGRPARSFIAVGLRGVGKTVLLNRVKQEAATEGLRSISLEAREDQTLPSLLIPAIRALLLELDRLGALSEAVKKALRILKSFMSSVKLQYADAELQLDIDPEPGLADSGDINFDLPELILALGRAAQSRESGVALIVDELQYLSERDLGVLIMSLHRVAQENLPLVMIAAGLPQIIGLTGRSKSYAERLFRFERLDALPHEDAARALTEPALREGVAITPDAVAEIIQATQGYPYFLQEWAYHSWNLAQGDRIDRQAVQAAGPVAIKQLDQGFFRVRFDRLTPRERFYLRAMASLGPGPHRSGDVAAAMGVDIKAIGPLRNNLINKGMIYSPAHGDTAFTVPLFDEFLIRTIPEWHSVTPGSS